MDVTLGLVSALFWGITDFLGGPAARRVGVRHAVFATNAVGLLVLLIVLGFTPDARHKLFSVDAQGALFAIAAAALLLCATLTLSTALKTGKAGIVAPVAMSYGVVTTILSLFAGDHLATIKLIGIAICMVGVPLTGLATEKNAAPNSTGRRPLVSVALAVCAMICFGTSYWIQGRYAIKAIGSMGTMAINYAFATCVLGTALLLLKTGKSEPPAMRYPLVLVQAIVSLLALGAFSWGLSIGNTATLSVLSTLSGGVTALLGFAFRGETLNRWQWAGVVTVTMGAVVVRI